MTRCTRSVPSSATSRGGTGVEPQHRRPQRLPVLGDAREALPLVGDRQRGDAARVDALRGPPDRGARGGPPVLGVLLAPARVRRAQLERRAPLGDRVACGVPHHGLRGGRRAVDADDEVAGRARGHRTPPSVAAVSMAAGSAAAAAAASTASWSFSVHRPEQVEQVDDGEPVAHEVAVRDGPARGLVVDRRVQVGEPRHRARGHEPGAEGARVDQQLVHDGAVPVPVGQRGQGGRPGRGPPGQLRAVVPPALLAARAGGVQIGEGGEHGVAPGFRVGEQRIEIDVRGVEPVEQVLPGRRGDHRRHADLRAVQADRQVVGVVEHVEHVADHVLDAGQAGRGAGGAGDDAAGGERADQLPDRGRVTAGDTRGPLRDTVAEPGEDRARGRVVASVHPERPRPGTSRRAR